MKARGMTRANLAIFNALDLAIENYLSDGNNQIILASDGIFSFTENDYKIWSSKVEDKKILISTIGFGRDKKALNNLKEISRKGAGTFIPINSRQDAYGAIFNEVELRSRK